MAKIYLPSDLVNKDCKVVYNDYIRVFTNNSYSQWVDIFFKNDYILKNGSSNYPQTVVCDNLNTYTNDFYYRYDFDKIIIMFFIFIIICIWFPYKLISRILGKWGTI